jgi:chaperonin GroEL (HSP60 family)
MTQLRAKRDKADVPHFGVDVFSGKIKNMLELNVIEPLRVKQQIVKSATEAAGMILKIDDTIASKGMGREGPKTPKTPSEPPDYD